MPHDSSSQNVTREEKGHLNAFWVNVLPEYQRLSGPTAPLSAEERLCDLEGHLPARDSAHYERRLDPLSVNS